MSLIWYRAENTAHPVATKCTVISFNFIIPTILPHKKMPFDIADNITPRYVILEICYPVVHLDLISVITPRSWRNSSIGRGKSAVRYKRAIKVYHKTQWLTEGFTAYTVKGVSGELNDGHEKITEHQAGDMMSLAAPMQNVMRGWQQPTGCQRGCQEDHANDEAHGVQGEPDIGRLHYRSGKFSNQNDLFLIS